MKKELLLRWCKLALAFCLTAGAVYAPKGKLWARNPPEPSCGELRKAHGKQPDETIGFAAGGGQNTVPGEAQVLSHGFVRFEGRGRTGGVLCVGSSYAWHGPNVTDLGWPGDWGMAASARSNDCVHVVWDAIRRVRPEAPLCIAQSAIWERNYTGDVTFLERHYADCRAFKPDWIVIISTVANAPKALAESEPLGLHYARMVDWFVNLNLQAKVVLSVGSSGKEFTRAIQAYAADKGYPVVDFREFLDRPGMRAKGLFRHPGVAWHPSDLGMRELGRRYARALGLPMADR